MKIIPNPCKSTWQIKRYNHCFLGTCLFRVSSSEQTRFISLSLHQVPASKSSSQKNRRVLVPQSHGFFPGSKAQVRRSPEIENVSYVYLALIHCKGIADIHSMQTDLGKCLSILASCIKIGTHAPWLTVWVPTSSTTMC